MAIKNKDKNMNKSIFAILLLIPAVAMATDPRPPVQVDSDGARLTIRLTGSAAKAVFDALRVEPSIEFGIVQKQIKKTDSISCEQAILGDTGRSGNGVRFTCFISEANR